MSRAVQRAGKPLHKIFKKGEKKILHVHLLQLKKQTAGFLHMEKVHGHHCVSFLKPDLRNTWYF